MNLICNSLFDPQENGLNNTNVSNDINVKNDITDQEEIIEIHHVTIKTLKLTNDQKKALIQITDFMHSRVKGLFMLLESPAGCGKTYITRLIIQYNNKLGPNRLRILGAANTHKSRKVLERNLNSGSFISVPTKTIANLLKKARMNSYLGHKKYNSGGNSLADFDFIIIDEASMIDDRDLEKIIEAAKLHNTKILFIGDKSQLPHPTQKLVKLGPDLLVKSDSSVFRLKNKIEMKEIVRQKEGNPILDVANHIRDNQFCTDLWGPYEHKDKLILKDPIVYDEPIIAPVVATTQLTNEKETESKEDPQEPKENTKESEINKELKERARITAELKAKEAEDAKRRAEIRKLTDERNRLCGVRFLDSMNFEASIVNDFKQFDNWRDPFEARIITYTNESVKTYNKIARQARFSRNPEFNIMMIAPGDLMLSYDTIGWPVPYIENGQDYIVTAVKRTENHPIIVTPGNSMPSPGFMVTMGETTIGTMEPLSSTIKTHFFPEIANEKNLPIFQELRKRAAKINEPSSGSLPYKHYYELKDQLVLTESMYEFKNKIFGESYFFKEHPLLRTRVVEVIEENKAYMPPKDSIIPTEHKEGIRKIRKNHLYQQLNALYPNLVEERMSSNHMLGQSEQLADRFLFIEKDQDYGYSATAHKAQGSTFDRVYVNDADIAKIRDRWNYQHNAYYRASKERNQLKYVALTRAQYLATVLSQKLEYSRVPLVELNPLDEDPFFKEE